MSGRIDSFFGGAFDGRRVLVTGHTGFKGAWLSMWLCQLGARVAGLALPVQSPRDIYHAAGLDARVDSRLVDIRDAGDLAAAADGIDAEIVFHMAAQPLVRASYDRPAETFDTNVVGTANVLDAVRRMPSVRAVVVVTSDKCYDNREWTWGYRENDRLGGADPYSASKACTEMVAQAYRNAFFADPTGPQLATVRAGNVFGGGDWSDDRLVPDIIRAALAGKSVDIRNPASIRPWQHVLEPLSGYLGLAARMVREGPAFAGAWNFGPDLSGTVDVGTLSDMFERSWGESVSNRSGAGRATGTKAVHEAGILRLDSTKAQMQLGWRPQFSLPAAVDMTVAWYRAQREGRDMAAVTEEQIKDYGNLMVAELPPPAVAAAE